MIPIGAVLASAATLACAVIDARTGFIPNRITYPSLAAMFLVAALSGTIWSTCFGMICVGGTLLLLYLITRKRGLGLGDVKLGACIGAGLGPMTGIFALSSSFIIGGLVGSYLLLTHRAHSKDPMRFGPFLAMGVCTALVR